MFAGTERGQNVEDEHKGKDTVEHSSLEGLRFLAEGFRPLRRIQAGQSRDQRTLGGGRSAARRLWDICEDQTLLPVRKTRSSRHLAERHFRGHEEAGRQG